MIKTTFSTNIEQIIKKNTSVFLDYTRVTYHVKFPNPSTFTYKDEKKLIQTLVWLTGAEFKDILVDGIREGSIIVSLLISDCRITTLKLLYNPENLSKTCLKMAKYFNYEIIKVVIQEDVIDMPGKCSFLNNGHTFCIYMHAIENQHKKTESKTCIFQTFQLYLKMIQLLHQIRVKVTVKHHTR